MNESRIFRLRGRVRIAALAAVGMIAITCNGKGNGGNGDQHTVTSDDGLATLTIPAGAMPEGVSVSDIEVLAVTPEELELQMTGVEFLAAYRLLPDGAQFSEPVTLTLETDLSGEKGISFFHAYGEEDVEALEITDSVVNEEENRVTSVTVSLSHFSTILGFSTVLVGPYSVAAPVPPTDTPVGGLLNVLVQVTAQISEEEEVTFRGFREYPTIIRTTMNSNWDLEFAVLREVIAMQPLEPTVCETDPGSFGGETPADVKGNFKCEEDGDFMLQLWLTTKFYYTSRYWKRLDTEDVFMYEETSSRTFRYTTDWTKRCVPVVSDAANDHCDSISSNEATYTVDFIDILSNGALWSDIDQSGADSTFNRSLLECGSVADGMRVVCPAGVEPMPAGRLLHVVSTHAGEVPQDDTGHSLIYSVVFDSDGDEANNWDFVPPYDWDLFRDTDRWYQLIWDHMSGTWSVVVTQVDASQSTTDVTSTARAVIDGDTVNWFISDSEFSAAQPGYRVTAFGHDGFYSPDDRGADVSGANPTEPLLVPQ